MKRGKPARDEMIAEIVAAMKLAGRDTSRVERDLTNFPIEHLKALAEYWTAPTRYA
jgi:hypothetical protein